MTYNFPQGGSVGLPTLEKKSTDRLTEYCGLKIADLNIICTENLAITCIYIHHLQKHCQKFSKLRITLHLLISFEATQNYETLLELLLQKAKSKSNK